MWQHFQRHVPVELGVSGPIHRYTSPMPPSPILAVTEYGPSEVPGSKGISSQHDPLTHRAVDNGLPLTGKVGSAAATGDSSFGGGGEGLAGVLESAGRSRLRKAFVRVHQTLRMTPAMEAEAHEPRPLGSLCDDTRQARHSVRTCFLGQRRVQRGLSIGKRADNARASADFANEARSEAQHNRNPYLGQRPREGQAVRERVVGVSGDCQTRRWALGWVRTLG